MDRDQKLFFKIFTALMNQVRSRIFFICNLLGRNANLNFQNQEWLYTTKFLYTNVLSTTNSSYYSNIISRTTVNKLIKPAETVSHLASMAHYTAFLDFFGNKISNIHLQLDYSGLVLDYSLWGNSSNTPNYSPSSNPQSKTPNSS